MLVRDLMSTDLVTAPADASLREAVGRMLEGGVGSVIVLNEGEPAGMVTETDALLAGYRTDRPLGSIPVRSVMSGPVVTVTPSTPVREAIDRMVTNDIKKLPVLEGIDLVGIVTMSDVVDHHGALLQRARSIEEQRERWESE